MRKEEEISFITRFYTLCERFRHNQCGSEDGGGTGGFSVSLTENYNLLILLIPVWDRNYQLINATFQIDHSLPSAQGRTRTVASPSITSNTVSNITSSIASMVDNVGHCPSVWEVSVKDSPSLHGNTGLHTASLSSPCDQFLDYTPSPSCQLQLVTGSRARRGRKSLLPKYNIYLGCKGAGISLVMSTG